MRINDHTPTLCTSKQWPACLWPLCHNSGPHLRAVYDRSPTSLFAGTRVCFLCTFWGPDLASTHTYIIIGIYNAPYNCKTIWWWSNPKLLISVYVPQSVNCALFISSVSPVWCLLLLHRTFHISFAIWRHRSTVTFIWCMACCENL